MIHSFVHIILDLYNSIAGKWINKNNTVAIECGHDTFQTQTDSSDPASKSLADAVQTATIPPEDEIMIVKKTTVTDMIPVTPPQFNKKREREKRKECHSSDEDEESIRTKLNKKSLFERAGDCGKGKYNHMYENLDKLPKRRGTGSCCSIC